MNFKLSFLFCIILIPNAALPCSSSSLKFLNEQVIPASVKGVSLPVGGLSALTFNEQTNSFLALSDDKKNHRFYKLKIVKQEPYRFKIQKEIMFRESFFKKFQRNMDPEGFQLYKNKIFIASEGQQIFAIPEPPQIHEFSKSGIYKKSWETPLMFWNPKQMKTFGTQENKGFESLTIDSKDQILWTATERPLRQDLKTSHKKIRLSGFNLKTKKLLFQFPYDLDHRSSGLVEMIWLKGKTFLTLERSYKKDKKVHIVKLFFTDCTQLKDMNSPSCRKKQLFDFKRNLKSIKIDNIEGMALGPLLASGERLLVFVSDNNFKTDQKNQVLFFSFKNPSLP